MSELKDQPCPFCGENKCVLLEDELEIPYFGRVFVFSMECLACNTKQSDVEPAETKAPARYTLEVEGESDLSIKIVKSGEAIVKIPHVITIEPGPASDGYVTNVEGLLERVKKVIQSTVNNEDDESAKKKAKNLLKKLGKVLVGREPLKIIIEDHTGNSAIISDKAKKSNL